MATKPSAEAWRPVRNMPAYSVSMSGKVRRDEYTDSAGRLHDARLLLVNRHRGPFPTFYRAHAGYVRLVKDGRVYQVTPADLVAATFLGASRQTHDLHFRDGNSRNANLLNLVATVKGIPPLFPESVSP